MRKLYCYESPRGTGAKVGGEGGIRTPVPLTGQDAFEAPPLRPLRYLSAEGNQWRRTTYFTLSGGASNRRLFRGAARGDHVQGFHLQIAHLDRRLLLRFHLRIWLVRERLALHVGVGRHGFLHCACRPPADFDAMSDVRG